MPRVIDVVAAIGASLRRHLFWTLVVVVALLGTAGFLWWQAAGRRPQYVTAAVTLGNIQRNVSTTGALNPVVTVQVGSYVSGTIKALGCDFNTEVVVGQVCARIDPVPFQLIVDEDRAEVATAQAQLRKDQAAQVYAKTAFERDSKLLAEGTVSQDAVDNDKSVYDQSIAQVGLDQATVADKQAALKAAEVNLAYTNIVSPVVGTVITRSIDVGQTVAASLQTPTLFLIGKDLTKMQVDTNVSEADVGLVRMGQDAVFSVQAFPGRTFHGRVWQIRRGPITVQNVVTYDVVIAFENPQRLLFPGMTADTHIVIDEHDNVLRVPLPAVRFTPEGMRRAGGGRGGAGAAGGGAGGGGVGAAGSQETAEGAPAAAGSAGEAASAAGSGGAAGPSGPGGSPASATAAQPGGQPGEPGERGAGAAAGEERRHGGFRHHGQGGGQGEGGQGQEARGQGEHGAAWRRRPPAGGEERQGPPGGGERPGGPSAGGEGRHQGGRQGRPGGGVARRVTQVWVLNADGSIRPVQVTTGLDDGTLIEVSGAGLKAGDKVVVNEILPEERRRGGAGQGPGQGGQGFRQPGAGGPGGGFAPGGGAGGPRL